jgi:hypothetical protein
LHRRPTVTDDGTNLHNTYHATDARGTRVEGAADEEDAIAASEGHDHADYKQEGAGEFHVSPAG